LASNERNPAYTLIVIPTTANGIRKN